MNNYSYKVFHIDGIDEKRDQAVEHIDTVLHNIDRLNLETINYSDEEQAQDFIEKYPEFKANRKFKVGELGIWASNYNAWAEFLKSDYDYLLIMEDDCKLEDGFVEGMKEYISRLPEGWGFFSPFVHWWQQQNIYNKDLHDYGDKDICLAYQSWSLACYFVSKNGARKALEILKDGFEDPVDWFLFKNKKLFKFYTLKPEAKKYCDLLYLNTTIQEEKVSQYPNWFNNAALGYFNRNLTQYAGMPNLKYLQIGTYTGDATVWLKENVLTDPTSYLTDVDTWEGSDEAIHKEFDWKDVEQVYDEKVSKYNNIIKHKGNSVDFMKSEEPDQYDLIYIDGDHTEKGVYLDASLAWPLLKRGGILAFDDYTWEHDSKLPEMKPKPAIDRFVEENKKDLHVLDVGDQYWILKK